jgi:two-component system OmpR family response regulator
MRLLLVEDDKETARYVSNGLVQAGHTIDVVSDGKDGLALAIRENYDLVILDRMLPGIDGLSLARTLRTAGSRVSILFLTSLGGVNDRVQGLDVGGDDYLVKPFAFAELLARVNALGRRAPMRSDGDVLRAGDLELDIASRTVKRGQERLCATKDASSRAPCCSSASGASTSTRAPASSKRISRACAQK